MKKLMALLLVLALLLPSTTAFGEGEVLNLPPFVDFEVTEKKKVDVIVDIGNTSHSMSTINSLINTTLRPQLTAKGMDYNIIVKDTNEGIDHFYIMNKYADYPARKDIFKLYRYDLSTNMLREIQIQNTIDPNRININGGVYQYYYDPSRGILFFNSGIIDLSTNSFNMPDELPINDDFSNMLTHLHSRYTGQREAFYFQNGDYLSVNTFNGGFIDPYIEMVPYEIIKNSTGYHYKRKATPQHIRRATQAGVSDRYIVLPNKEIIHLEDTAAGFYNGSYFPGDSYLSKYTFVNNQLNKTLMKNYLEPSGQINFFSNNQYLVRHGEYVNQYNRNWVTALYDVKLNRVTYPTSYADVINGRKYMWNERIKPNEYDNENQVYIKLENDGLSMAKGFGMPYQKYQYPFTVNRTDTFTLQAIYGNNVLFMHATGHVGHSYLFNTNTLAFTRVGTFSGDIYSNSTGHALVSTAAFRYPVDYDAQRYLVRDVIREQQHRYDADVYYVRLDDTISEQFTSPTLSSEIANLMNKNNMTFIGLAGQAAAKSQHDQMLQLLDYNGKTILNTNLQQAFTEATNFMINKKDIDLHILQSSSSPLTASQIQAVTTQLRNELRSSNYVVNVNHVVNTPQNLFNLSQLINWNDYRNSYVLSFDTTALNELNTEEIVSTLASNMNTHDAHFLSYGSTSNRAKRASVLDLMSSRGYLSQQTNTTTIVNEIKNYIIRTAESNPKRHIRKLVLKHDPVTDQFSSEINLNAYYFDHEGDRQKAERFKTEHDPTVYENHTGLMANTGVYLNTAITRFTKVGKYDIVAQKQDTPTNNNSRFSNYDLWSEDSLSRLVLYVHRQPVAQFQAYFNSSNQFILNDLSYDLDHYSRYAKGIVKWDWKYKRTTETTWTSGKPSGLNANYEYMIALRVQDIDEAWSNEYMVYVGRNAAPVAYFEVSPSKASWTSNPTIADLSYSPSGLALTAKEWKVYREGRLLLSSSTQPTTAQIKQLANQTFANAVGTYKVELKVRDSANQWSETYATTYELINYEPIPLFEVEQPLYRDSLLKLENLTGARDLDGEVISFSWQLKKDGRTFTYTQANPQIIIKDRGLGKSAVGKWEVTLSARDTLNKEGRLTKEFEVLNHIPTSSITGDDTANLDDIKTYTGEPHDQDSEDQLSLRSYWRVTKPSGEVLTGNGTSYTIHFDQKGSYTIQHWVVDQLEASSDVYTRQVMVLNKPPVADFTMLPNPTYRGMEIQFKSLAYDQDGYISSIRYTAENVQGTVSLLSTEQDFIRAFNSVGTLKITQTVTDDDQEEASITKELKVENRLPTVQITSPSSISASSPTIFNNFSPLFSWIYDDADLDEQKQVELTISPLLHSPPIFSRSILLFHQGAAAQLQASGLELQDGQTYSIIARAYDGFDYGPWSLPAYFKIVLNTPPTAGFIEKPRFLYEGDTMSIYHQVEDRDKDTLYIQYRLTDEAGKTTIYPSSTTYYEVTPSQYEQLAFRYKSEREQLITIEQLVTDRKSDAVSLRRAIRFHPLTLTADVRHTTQWERYRQEYNQKKGSQTSWGEKQFYAGEKFVLHAATTAFDYVNTDTTVYPVKVEVSFPTSQATITLTKEGDSPLYKGEYYEEALNKLKNGRYSFNFTVFYSNGVIKYETVEIEIIGEAISFIGVHRLK